MFIWFVDKEGKNNDNDNNKNICRVVCMICNWYRYVWCFGSSYVRGESEMKWW